MIAAAPRARAELPQAAHDRLRCLLPMLAILLAAAFLRLFRLDTVPPGMFSDIATNGLDIQDILAGHLRLFFPANNGREALFIYFQGLLVAGAGSHLLVYTFAAVCMGMLSVALTYRLGRAMFGPWPATAAAGLLAVALWGVALSRVGLRFSSLPPALLACLYLLWRTLHAGGRRYAALTGLAAGLSQYTYTSARLVPLLLAALCLVDWRLAWKRRAELGLAAAMAAAVFLPEGLYFARHPDQFLGRAAQVSVFNPNPQVERSHDTLWSSVVKTAGMFFVHGDEDRRGNLPGRPVFDPPLAALFAAGLALTIARLRRGAAYRWLLVWLAIMCLPSALSQSSPDQFRTYSAAPAAFLLAAIGIEAAAVRAPARVRPALPAAVIAWTALWTAGLYFGVWARDPRTDDAFGGGAYRLAGFLAQQPQQPLFLAFHDRWPVEVLEPRTQRAHWFREDISAVPVPASDEASALYVAAPFSALAAQGPGALPGLQPLPHSTAATGVPDFLAFRWPAAARAGLGPRQAIGAAMPPDFVLASFSLAGQPGSQVLNLFWQPLAAAGPYDLYVHVLDSTGRQVRQADTVAWPVEEGPAGDYLLLTRCPLDLPPGSYVAEAGAVHRSFQDPSRLNGGPIGQPARIPLQVG